jgi:hypothetical protein
MMRLRNTVQKIDKIKIIFEFCRCGYYKIVILRSFQKHPSYRNELGDNMHQKWIAWQTKKIFFLLTLHQFTQTIERIQNVDLLYFT